MDCFVAIDVETANHNPSSICSIGAVKVTENSIVDRFYSLVQPEPNWYSGRFTKIHGICDDDTWDAPTFEIVWKRLVPWIGRLPVIAHNAPFDGRCIREACRIYRLDPPDQPFLCTLKSARRQIPAGMCPSKSLPMLCGFFGIPFNDHHNALADAEACAKLGMILL